MECELLLKMNEQNASLCNTIKPVLRIHEAQLHSSLIASFDRIQSTKRYIITIAQKKNNNESITICQRS